MPRRATQPVGQLGEAVAARFLERRGLRIVARNVRSRLGEIDLVARDGPTLVFVEVKTRAAGASDPPQAAVDARKQARLARVALGYLARHPHGAQPCRFDVVAITLAPSGSASRVDYFPNAFGVEDAGG